MLLLLAAKCTLLVQRMHSFAHSTPDHPPRDMVLRQTQRQCDAPIRTWRPPATRGQSVIGHLTQPISQRCDVSSNRGARSPVHTCTIPRPWLQTVHLACIARALAVYSIVDDCVSLGLREREGLSLEQVCWRLFSTQQQWSARLWYSGSRSGLTPCLINRKHSKTTGARATDAAKAHGAAGRCDRDVPE